MAINQTRMKEREDEGYKREPEKDEFIPEVGKTYLIRPLPRDMDEYLSPEGADDFCYVYRFHFQYIKPDGTKIFNIMCPKTWGMDKSCDICKEGWELFNSPSEEDKKLSKKFYRNERALLNVFVLDDEKSVAKGVQWFRAPIKKVYEEVRKLVINPAWTIQGKDILDLVYGRNWTLTVKSAKESGTGFVDYEMSPGPNSFDISPYLVGDWQEKIAALITHKPRTTNEDIQKLLTVRESKSDGRTPPPPGSVPPPAGSVGGAPAAPPQHTDNASNKEQSLKQEAPAAPAAPAAPPAPPAVAAPPVIQEASAAQTAAPTAGGTKPECFGKKYAPRTPECVACKAQTPQVLQDCRKKYLDA